MQMFIFFQRKKHNIYFHSRVSYFLLGKPPRSYYS